MWVWCIADAVPERFDVDFWEFNQHGVNGG